MRQKSNALTFLEKHNKGPLTFGQALVAIRETEEISQAQLAKNLSCSRGIICDIEKGRRMVTVSLAIKIAKHLGYPAETFLVLLFRDQLRKEKLDNKFIVEIKVA